MRLRIRSADAAKRRWPPGQTDGLLPHQRSGPPLLEAQPQPRSGAWIQPRTSVLALVALCVAGYFIWLKTSAPKPRPSVPADQVVMAFLQAKSTGDINRVKPYLSKASIEILDRALGSRQAESAGFTRSDAQDMLLWGVEPTKDHLQGAVIKAAVVEDKEVGEDAARVRATMAMKFGPFGAMEAGFDYILVIEDKQWRIDLLETSNANVPGVPQLIG